MNLGVAMITVANKKATKGAPRPTFGIPDHHANTSSMRFESNKALADTLGYELVIRPYKVGRKNKGYS